MKLYTSLAPNPVRVSLFIAEKGLDISTEAVDILGGETRSEPFGSKNSLHELPVLELDDGFHLTESLAICTYLEALFPEKPLMGRDALECAKIHMWTRRIEQQIFDKPGEYGMHTMPLFADKIQQIPAYAQSMIVALENSFLWLDRELADGRTYLVEDEFSLADIVGMSALFILAITELEIPSQATHVQRWASALMARPSWQQCVAGDVADVKADAEI